MHFILYLLKKQPRTLSEAQKTLIFAHRKRKTKSNPRSDADSAPHKTLTTMKALNYLAAFIGGIAIGGVAGILLAPEKGSDTRERIAEALRKRGIRLDRKEMDALVDDITEELQNVAAPEE